MSNESDTKEEVNYLDMSDEDMEKLELPIETTEDDSGTSDDASTTDTGDQENDGQKTDEREQDTGNEDSTSSGEGTGSDNSSTSDGGSEEGETSDEGGDGSVEQETKESSGEGKGTSESNNDSGSQDTKGQNTEGDGEKSGQDAEPESPELDHKAAYEQVMAPFKANGRQMEVKSIEEVRRLMSMGANYNSKMASLKPNLKILKMLENNDILDEEKLSFLIDINKKDPTAITKLIKDSGVNPLDIDVEKDSGYKSKTYTVSDNEVDLDQVLQDVNATETGKRTIDILSNRWDEASKQAIVSSPKIISIINEQVASGVYDQIIDQIDRARVLGEFVGVSDIEAYKQMGNHMQVNRMFKGMEKTPNPANTETNTIVKPKAKADDLQLKERKKAASVTKGSGRSQKKLSGLDILNMPDEEFDKLSAPI